MRHRGKWTLTQISALAVLILPNLAVGATYYVDALVGDDSAGGNNCTVEADPCRTITHAFTQVPAGTAGDPSIIMVAAGTYDQAGNGEVYPITLTRDYISLVGEDTATTIFDGSVATTDNALNINARGFSLSGFTFRNSGTALEVSQGGYTVSNNIFEDTIGTGIYSSLWNPSDDENFTVDPVSFTNNSFACIDYGVDFKIGLTFDGVTQGLSATVGNITVTGNTFVNTGFTLDELYIRSMDTGTATVGNITATDNTFMDCSTGIELDELYVENMVESTVTWGNINVDGNIFTDNSNAIIFAGSFGSSGNIMDDTSVTLGDMSVSNNTITDNTSYGMQIDYFTLDYIYGTSTVLFGNLTINGNTIETDSSPVAGYGIYIYDIGEITNIYEAATVTTGIVSVNNNTIESDSYGLYINNYGIYYIGVDDETHTVDINFGPTVISGNQLTSSSSYGLYLDFDYFGYDQFAQTTVDVALITIHDNVITSTGSDAFYMYYLYESGYNMTNDAQLNIAGLAITDNTITSSGGDGLYLDMYELGYDMYDNSRMSVGPTTISGNTITAKSEALYFDFTEVPTYMYDSSTFTMAPWTISNNVLSTADSADYGALTIYYYDYYVGSYMEDDSSATLPDWVIRSNKIDVKGGDDGIYYFTYSNPDDNYGNAAVHYGSVLIDNNIFNENKDGGMDKAIDFWIEDVCENCYESSTFSHDDITITNNSIYNVEDIGINVEYDDVAYAFDDDGRVTMGNVTIADNLIDTAPYGIYAGYASIESEALAVVTLGTLDITGNTVKNIIEEGIRFDISASIDDPTAVLTIGKTTISDNTVTASDAPGAKSAGIWIDGEIGEDVVFAAPEVSNNTVTGFNAGIGMDDLPEATISCNSVENSGQFGLFFLSDGAFTAVNNTLVDNGLGLKIEGDSTATVMAENNWWGDAAGPLACASCNGIDAGGGDVDYTPWLAGLPSSQCGGFPWIMFMPAITGMGK